MEDQALEVASKIGQRQFGLGSGDPDGVDEQTEAVLLMGEHMLDPGAHR